MLHFQQVFLNPFWKLFYRLFCFLEQLLSQYKLYLYFVLLGRCCRKHKKKELENIEETELFFLLDNAMRDVTTSCMRKRYVVSLNDTKTLEID